jgi:glucokinase
MSKVAGIDLGATHIRYAVLEQTRDGLQIVDQTKGETPKSVDDLMDQILGFVIPDDVEAVGVAVPGPVKNGRLLFCPNIPGLQDGLTQQVLENFWNVPVTVGNDANLAALGEYYVAVPVIESLVFLTISTGIGGGIVLDGKVWEGIRGLAGELGHVVAMSGGPATGAGIFGGLEALASGTAMARNYNAVFGQTLPPTEACQTLFALDAQGDARAHAVVDQAVGHIATAIHNLNMVLNPESFLLGGGISLNCPKFINLVSDQVESQFGRKLDIRLAQLGDDAGLYGAAIAAQNLIV